MFKRIVILACLTIALVGLYQAGPVEGEDKIKDLIKSNGFVEIKVVEAHVPDLDPLPMQRDSDVFVRVYVNDTKELICETQVVQDDNTPKVSFAYLLLLYLYYFQLSS